MKKSKISVAKLQLSKETISSLTMDQVKGGATVGPTFCTLCSCNQECQLTQDIACAPTVRCPGSDLTTPCATC